MNKRDVINFSALSKELNRALNADKTRERENDAKLRAIHQNVATYEEFRQIVKACHLKPLDKKHQNSKPKQPWNPISGVNSELNHTSTESLQSVLSESEPRSESEFSRDWRRFKGCSMEKYAFLLRLGGQNLRELFHTEVAFGLLGEFLVVLNECFGPGDEAAVMGVLQGLSMTGRFALGVSLLSEVERGACERLFHNLLEAHPNLAGVPETEEERSAVCESLTKENIRDLMAKYRVCGNVEQTAGFLYEKN